MKFYLWLQSKDKTTVIAAEELTRTEEGMAGAKCNRKHAHFIAKDFVLPGSNVNSVVKFWSAWEMIYHEKDWNCGTDIWPLHHDNMPVHTPLKKTVFFLQKQHGGHPTPSVLTWSIPLWHHLVLQNENESEGPPLWHHRWNTNRIAGGSVGRPSIVLLRHGKEGEVAEYTPMGTVSDRMA